MVARLLTHSIFNMIYYTPEWVKIQPLCGLGREPVMAEKRGRNWTLVVYPESAPKNWRGILDDEHISWIESPLHDKDVNPDGEVKKAHWHILLLFEGNKSYKQVLEISKKLNAPIPQRVESARGMVRYMVHLDNPEKYQYNKSDIISHGGADADHFFKMTVTHGQDVLKEITHYILENKVTNFVELVEYAIENNDDWFDVIANRNTLFLNKLIDAMYQKVKGKR